MAKGGSNGVSDLSKAAKHRREDAQALFDAARWRGSMYVAGYSVECQLKATLMRMFRCRNLDELEEELQRRRILSATTTLFTHQLRLLLRLAGGLDRLQRNPDLWREFGVLNGWVPAWRYPADRSNREFAERFLAAVDAIGKWIDNNV